MKIKKLRYIGIILAVAISMTGCGQTADTNPAVANEQGAAGNESADNAAAIRMVGGFPVVENDSVDASKKAKYPYVVKTESSIWYLAADDIELMGEETFFAGLEEILGMADQDFADARDVLKDYMSKEAEPVEIYTDFCGKAEVSARAGAYCHPVSHFIKLFGDWKQAEVSLLHEYAHYLTFTCTDEQPGSDFGAEGIAEYVSMLACENRMCRKANYGAPEEYLEDLKKTEFWDTENDAIELRNIYHSMGLTFANGAYVDHEYVNVMLSKATRTEEMQQYMHANDCAYE